MAETVEVDCPRCKAREGFLMALVERLAAADERRLMLLVYEVACVHGLIKQVGGEYPAWDKRDWFVERKQG